MERLFLMIVEKVQVKTLCANPDYVQLVGPIFTHSVPHPFRFVLDDIVSEVSLQPFLLQLLYYCTLEAQS